ncbi:ABC transporter substrate-binding protein [Marinobacter piscensis]|uniref:ABC transporter substrate-binding protein n=1 Tax=Marinobacter piscensis TaxID=1562308 RepID=UPI001FE27990|nr:ABC transporter substrate-binding protein [Marinobacter piscensis]
MKNITVFIICMIITAIMPGGYPAALAKDGKPTPVYVVGSGNLILDQHVQTLLEQELGNSSILIPIEDKQASLTEDIPIVTIGAGAFSRIQKISRNAPVLALLVDQDFLEEFIYRSPGRVSGVYHNVPLLHQALIGKAILPQATRIALVSTTASADLYSALLDQLAEYSLEARLFVADTPQQLIPALNRALSYGDFLLAAPDTSTYNPQTIKHVLLTTYRRNRIVIGPSQAYVKAGALASGYAPYPAMARMAATYLNVFNETGQFPEPDYPAEFRVSVNRQVARSLNIPIATREHIQKTVELWLTQSGESRQ